MTLISPAALAGLRSNMEAAFAQSNARREALWLRAVALVSKWEAERLQREHREHVAAEMPACSNYERDA